MIFPHFPGVLSFFKVFHVEWEPCTLQREKIDKETMRTKKIPESKVLAFLRWGWMFSFPVPDTGGVVLELVRCSCICRLAWCPWSVRKGAILMDDTDICVSIRTSGVDLLNDCFGEMSLFVSTIAPCLTGVTWGVIFVTLTSFLLLESLKTGAVVAGGDFVVA